MQLYFIRGAAALVWAVLFATTSDDLTATTGVLLVLYPLIDLVASLIDARTRTGAARDLLRFDAGVSALAAVALAIAAPARSPTRSPSSASGRW